MAYLLTQEDGETTEAEHFRSVGRAKTMAERKVGRKLDWFAVRYGLESEDLGNDTCFAVVEDWVWEEPCPPTKDKE